MDPVYSSILSAIPMEVLLLDDITGIGKKDDLIVVKDGYALNFLLPRRRALVATPTVRKRYAEDIKRRAEERIREKETKEDQAAAVAGKEVHFTRKVTKTDMLYAAISEKAIAKALKDEHGLNVDSSTVQIPEPIKALGAFEVTVKSGEKEEKISVVVTAEKSEGP